MNQKLHDSGERRTFSSGAQRDRGTLKPRPDLISPHAQMREGMIFALGAKKYTERNWEKGMPISQCLASAQRHIEQWKLGLRDEDHLAQARWNLGAIIHYEEEIEAGRMDPAFANMPHYTQQEPVHVCPKCGHAPVECEFYETGMEYFCPKCEYNSLIDEDSEDNEPEPDDSQLDREFARPWPCGCVACIDPAGKDQDYSICQIFRSPATFYICGPMRGLPFLNFPAFDGARELGESLGHSIISPADMDRECGIEPIKNPISVDFTDLTSQQLAGLVRKVAARDVAAIFSLRKERGDGLALLPGWWDSVGGMAEVRLAFWLGLKFVDARDWEPIDMAMQFSKGKK